MTEAAEVFVGKVRYLRADLTCADCKKMIDNVIGVLAFCLEGYERTPEYPACMDIDLKEGV